MENKYKPDSWWDRDKEPPLYEYEVVVSISKVVKAESRSQAEEDVSSDIHKEFRIDDIEAYRN